jgi:hypothetical protein
VLRLLFSFHIFFNFRLTKPSGFAQTHFLDENNKKIDENHLGFRLILSFRLIISFSLFRSTYVFFFSFRSFFDSSQFFFGFRLFFDLCHFN